MPGPSRPDRMFRALLRLFPAEFRGDFGEQMAEDFRDQRHDAAANGTSRRLWIRTTADLLQRATREHADLFWRDAVYAVRLLRRHPASTAAAILSLAIGIGLNSAVFSVVSGVLWRGLPFANSDRLVKIYEVSERNPTQGSQVTPGDYLDWQRRARSFDELAGVTIRNLTIVEPGEPQSIGASAVSEGLFDVFGARPILGRLFTAAEYEESANRDSLQMTEGGRRQPSVMIISHSLWQGRFLGRPDIIGQKVRLSGGTTAEIVGVMGPEMAALNRVLIVQAWLPDALDASSLGGIVSIVGRLAPGVSVAAAQAELDVISATRPSTRPPDRRTSPKVQRLLDSIVNPVRGELMFLFGAVLCLLLVTCANVVNLFLAHASGRRLELAIRVALGATRGHLVRQTLTESLLLTALGGACGFLLAMWSVPALIAMAPRTIPRLNEIVVDWSTLAFTTSVAAAVGICCGLAASLPMNAPTPRGVLGRIRTSATPQGGRFRQGLTVVEIGLALMLVIASALMVRSIRALGAVDLGFNPDHVVIAGVPGSPRDGGSATAQRIETRRIEALVVERVKALPGVVAAGIGTGPLTGGMFIGGLEVPGNPRDFGLIRADAISPGYFEALGARLLAGRSFESRDTADGAATVAILNEAAARLFWGDGHPLGRSVIINKRDRLEVVGVVGDVRAGQLDADPGPAIYQPHVQSRNFIAGTMLIRTDGDPNILVPAIRTIFKAVNPEQPFRGVEPLQDRIDQAMAPRRFILRLIGLFSILTMILAIVGVYGVLAESVAQRIPEIGIRIALGATASNVLALILRQGLWMVAFGIGLGLGGAVLLRGVMRTMVFGVRTLDPSAYVAACLFLVIATLAACAIPARRAARLDPVEALRLE